MSQYATTTDLANLGLKDGWLTADVTTAIQDEALEKASGELDDFLGNVFELPLVAPYPDSLIAKTVDIAVYRLMKRRGFNPNDPGDQLIVKAYDDAMAWAKMVSNKQVRLIATDSTPSVHESAPEVSTGTLRGW